jgi:hypothetical protein
MTEPISFSGTARPDVYCPGNLDVICPARMAIAEQYVSHLTVNEAADMPIDYSPLTDAAKMAIKMRESWLAAVAINCAGVTPGGDCPTRTRMNESEARVTLVNGFRRFFKKGNNEE